MGGAGRSRSPRDDRRATTTDGPIADAGEDFLPDLDALSRSFLKKARLLILSYRLVGTI